MSFQVICPVSDGLIGIGRFAPHPSQIVHTQLDGTIDWVLSHFELSEGVRVLEWHESHIAVMGRVSLRVIDLRDCQDGFHRRARSIHRLWTRESSYPTSCTVGGYILGIDEDGELRLFDKEEQEFLTWDSDKRFSGIVRFGENGLALIHEKGVVSCHTWAVDPDHGFGIFPGKRIGKKAEYIEGNEWGLAFRTKSTVHFWNALAEPLGKIQLDSPIYCGALMGTTACIGTADGYLVQDFSQKDCHWIQTYGPVTSLALAPYGIWASMKEGDGGKLGLTLFDRPDVTRFVAKHPDAKGYEVTFFEGRVYVLEMRSGLVTIINQ